MKAYLDLVEQALTHGKRKENRTGIDTLSCFALSYRVDLAEGYPLLTTKKVFFNSMLRETLWYLSGEDHIRDLREHTKIWDAWANEQGDLQTAYGRFWRRFPIPSEESFLGGEVFAGKNHPNVRQEADGSFSFDQIGFIIEELKRNPYSRRLVVSAWHPANAAISKLPPCHYTWTLNVQPDAFGNPHTLNCHLTQRSADIALGVPFNLACYALLTQAIAQETGLALGEFVHTLIDAHVYVNHIDGLKQQLARKPHALPKLLIASKPLDALQFEDFTLENYHPHPHIRFDVAV